MLDIDPKLTQAIGPSMERMLVVDSSATSARFLTELLRQIWPGQVWTAATTAQAADMAARLDPQLIFVEYRGEGLDGLEFTRKLRRSELACRKAPVIMVTAQATSASILGARDAGVHEFLRRPFTNKDLLRRLAAVTLQPRRWVEGVQYVGPDRRRFNSADYVGPKKRKADGAAGGAGAPACDTLAERIEQPLKIIAAAMAAIDTDPAQALRSLNAQAAELQATAKTERSTDLMVRAAGLARYLAQVGPGQPLTRAGLKPHADPLLALLPKDAEVRARTAA